MTDAADRPALRALAHQLLCAGTGAVDVTRLCPRCGSGEHGRPQARVESGPVPHVSISYATGLVAVAWAWDGPVGIDVEVDGPPVDRLQRASFSAAEARFKAGADAPVHGLDLPSGFVGAVAGRRVSWRLAGPAAPAR